MPTYTVQHPDGRTLKIDGPTPPGEAELDQIFAATSTQKPTTPGMLAPGNIDMSTRPKVKNADGSISTVRSISINQDGKEILIPTVSDDGKVLSNADAIALYRKSGKHLGMFRDADTATAFAQALHESEAKKLDAPPTQPMTFLGRPVNPQVAERLRQIQASERDRTMQGANEVPAVLGTVGGMAGGIPGAALGGAVGSAVKQVVLRGGAQPSPEGPLAQAKNIAADSVTQGALQGGGEALAWGGGKLSKWLMDRATTRVTAKLAREFPELSDTLIDNALSVSQAGYEKARGLLSAAKAKANMALRIADHAGSVVPIEITPDLAESFKTALIERAIKSGTAAVPAGAPVTVATSRLDPATKALIAKIETAASGGHIFDATPSLADVFKTQLQKESRALYANRVAPNGPRAMAAEASLKAEFASRLNDGIDAVAKGYQAANAQAKPLIGALRGIEQARRPSGNLYQAMLRPAIGAALGAGAGAQEGGPGAAAGAVIGGFATTPNMMSREAIALSHPIIQRVLSQLPKATAELFTEFLAQHAASAPAPSSGPPR